MKWENLSVVPQSFHYELTEETHVEVQTQIYSWSDTVERTPVCSQTKTTGSGRNFEGTTVWTMVWRWSDQWSIWSQKSGPWSGDGLISGKFGLKILIVGEFERTWVWAEANLSAYGSDKDHSERRIVWSWPLRKQLSLIIVWLKGLGNGLNLSLENGLEMVWSELLQSGKFDQRFNQSGKSDRRFLWSGNSDPGFFWSVKFDQMYFWYGESDQRKVWVWTSTWKDNLRKFSRKTA